MKTNSLLAILQTIGMDGLGSDLVLAVGCDCVYDRLMYLFTELQIIYRLTGQSEKSNI